jgi:predicted transcriptional regulator
MLCFSVTIVKAVVTESEGGKMITVPDYLRTEIADIICKGGFCQRDIVRESNLSASWVSQFLSGERRKCKPKLVLQLKATLKEVVQQKVVHDRTELLKRVETVFALYEKPEDSRELVYKSAARLLEILGDGRKLSANRLVLLLAIIYRSHISKHEVVDASLLESQNFGEELKEVLLLLSQVHKQLVEFHPDDLAVALRFIQETLSPSEGKKAPKREKREKREKKQKTKKVEAPIYEPS